MKMKHPVNWEFKDNIEGPVTNGYVCIRESNTHLLWNTNGSAWLIFIDPANVLQ